MQGFLSKTVFLAAAAAALCGLSPPSCLPRAAPPCWTKASIQQAKESGASVEGVKEAAYKGVHVYPDPSNWASGARITKEPCHFEVQKENGRYVIKSSLFPHPLSIISPMDPGNGFYLAAAGEGAGPGQAPGAGADGVFVLQQIPRTGGASLSHEHFTSEGELAYGQCGKGYKKDLNKPSCLAD